MQTGAMNAHRCGRPAVIQMRLMFAVLAAVVRGGGGELTNPSAVPYTARLMATLPAGAVGGIAEELRVYEDLTVPGSPIVFVGASGFRVDISKSGEPQVRPSSHCCTTQSLQCCTSQSLQEDDLGAPTHAARSVDQPLAGQRTFHLHAAPLPPSLNPGSVRMTFEWLASALAAAHVRTSHR